MLMYSVLLDSVSSSISVSENEGAMPFVDACNEILEYTKEANYVKQNKLWENILNRGEEDYLSNMVV